MKPISLAPLPPDQLDELAAGLDAGWDTPEPAQAGLSQAPLSTAPSVDDLDREWDSGNEAAAAPVPVAARERAKRVRPSPNPSPERFERPGAAPLRVSKQERREAERQRLAHQAKQKSASKQQRKTARQEEARRASEQRRTEQQAQNERRAAAEPKRPKPVTKRAEEPSPRRASKQARREQTARAPEAVLAPVKTVPAKASSERSGATFAIILAVALAFAASLWFALSRGVH
ncbi:MAG: hypothetical protein ABI488_22945 [Polyangiaceae bacterium]